MIWYFIIFIVGVLIGFFVAALMHSASAYSRDEENEYIKKHKRCFEFISDKQIEKDFAELGLDERVANFKIPERATKGSAGYDCYAPYDIILQLGEDVKVPTGLKAYMKNGEVLMAFPRSGLGFKYYCRLSNTVGIIDKDYVKSENEGHIFVKLRNEGNKIMSIKRGEAMCQFIFMPFLLTDGDNYNNGEERNGGFGSTTNKD